MEEYKKCERCRYLWQEPASPFYYCGKYPIRYVEKRYRLCLTNTVEIKKEAVRHIVSPDNVACEMFEAKF